MKVPVMMKTHRKDIDSMERKARRTQEFKKNHPYCCFCGGKRQTQTIEHTPPKILFIKKHRPDGLTFPACKRCNNGSSHQDMIFSMFALTQSPEILIKSPLNQRYQNQFQKLRRGIRNNIEIQDFFEHSSSEWHSVNGIIRKYKKAQLTRETVHNYLEPWLTKLTMALWYEHTRKIFSPKGAIGIECYMLHKAPVLQNLISRLPFTFEEQAKTLKQGSWSVPDQFIYSFTTDKQKHTGSCYATFHNGLSYLALIADKPDNRFHENASLMSDHVVWRTSEEEGIHFKERPVL